MMLDETYILRRTYVSKRTGRTHEYVNRTNKPLATARALKALQRAPLTKCGHRWRGRGRCKHFQHTTIEQLIDAGLAVIVGDKVLLLRGKISSEEGTSS